jgi:hypothetical protein
MSRFVTTLLMATLTLGACDRAPTAPTESAGPSGYPVSSAIVARYMEHSVSEIWGTYWQFECDDGYESEFIRLEGVVHNWMTLLDDAAGGFHFQWRSNATGARGIGEESGEVFRVVDTDNDVYNEAGDTRTGTLRSTRRLIATGSGRGFTMVWTARYLVADGTLLIHRQETQFECSR